MNTESELRELWKRQQAPIPSVREIMVKADKLKKDFRNKSLLMIIILIVTSAIIWLLWYRTDFQWATSRIGLTLVIVAILLGVVNFIKSAVVSFVEDVTTDTSKYLKHFLALRQQQRISQTRILSSYFVLLFSGVVLYLYESTLNMSMLAKTVAYLVTLGWIAFVWFYWRPRAIRKQQAKVDAIILKLQSINEDLSPGN